MKVVAAILAGLVAFPLALPVFVLVLALFVLVMAGTGLLKLLGWSWPFATVNEWLDRNSD